MNFEIYKIILFVLNLKHSEYFGEFQIGFVVYFEFGSAI